MLFLTSRTLFVLVIALACISASAQSSLQDDLSSHFSRVRVVAIEDRGQVLHLPTEQGSISIKLVENDIRSGNFRSEVTDADGRRTLKRQSTNTFVGVIDGEPNAVARFSVRDGRLLGMFESSGERYFVEPASAFSENAAAGDHLIYTAKDLLRHDVLSCGSHLIDSLDKASDFAVANAAAAPTTLRRFEIAVDSDFEYTAAFGGPSGAASEILGIFNIVDGLYESELRLSLSVVYQHFWTTPDPFAGANTEQTVRNFQTHWNANFPASSIPRDTAHLFSAKGNVLGQGWAFINVVCNNPSFSYGMSGHVSFASGQHLVTSHELAHNLGANHAEAPQSCANTLMNAGLTGDTPLTFCSYSRGEIGNHVATSGGCLANATSSPFDFDGDTKTDLSIFRPSAGQWWYSRSSDGGNRAFTFGTGSDRIVPADYTGDGKTDIALWRPSDGQWFVLRSEDSSFYSFPFGTSGDVPVPGDFDADGKVDAAVFRPAGSAWFISRSADGGTTISTFGIANDVPVNADYDGDGKSDLAIFRPSVGQWWIERSSAGSIALQFGAATDKTVPGDYTGDGKADIAVWRPSNGTWFIMRSENSSFYSFPYGTNSDVPSPGDYDGDGKFDAAVMRPSTSTWFANLATGSSLIQQFGISGDLAVPNAYVR